MTLTASIVLLNGDGVGPEVVREAKKVLDKIAEKSNVNFVYKEELIGGAAIDETGSPLPDKTLQACKEANAVLFGSVGGPQWPREVNGPAPEHGLLKLRKELGLYANIRPMFFPGQSLQECSPLKSSIVQGTDFTVVRELTGGLYFGSRQEETDGVAYDTMTYSVSEVQRITRIAAELALVKNPPAPIISVDKANVLASSRLWRRVVNETLAKEYPTLKVVHQLVDSCAMIMIKNPRYLYLNLGEATQVIKASNLKIIKWYYFN
jgi:3-isopropylmalate dehydrogenase